MNIILAVSTYEPWRTDRSDASIPLLASSSSSAHYASFASVRSRGMLTSINKCYVSYGNGAIEASEIP